MALLNGKVAVPAEATALIKAIDQGTRKSAPPSAPLPAGAKPL